MYIMTCASRDTLNQPSRPRDWSETLVDVLLLGMDLCQKAKNLTRLSISCISFIFRIKRAKTQAADERNTSMARASLGP